MPRKQQHSIEDVTLEPRKLPGQARSRKRVNLILDAAADLLVEQGFENVTTNMIAEKAGIPIGSVYQFFPNKFSILYALALRYLDRIAEVHEGAIGPQHYDAPWEDNVDRVFDALAKYWSSEKAIPVLWNGIQNAPDLRAAVAKFNENAGRNNQEMIQYILPNVDPLRRRLVARIMVAISTMLLSLSITDLAEQELYVVEELKLLTKAYLRAHMAVEKTETEEARLPEAVGSV